MSRDYREQELGDLSSSPGTLKTEAFARRQSVTKDETIYDLLSLWTFRFISYVAEAQRP